MHIRVVAKGIDREMKRVDDMAARAADLTRVMKGRAEHLVTVIKKDVFGASKQADGKPFAALQDSTIEARRKGKGPRRVKILVDTGRMRDLTFARPTKTGVIFGNADDADKVNAHLFGFNGTRKKHSRRGSMHTREGGMVFVPPHDVGPHHMKLPRRAFLPIDQSGRALFGSGPAQEWLARAMDRVKQWIEKGKL